MELEIFDEQPQNKALEKLKDLGVIVDHKQEAAFDGVQHRFKFANGWGASVVSHQYSYGGPAGLWEIAVLDRHGELNYTTPVTSDVLGYLSSDEVPQILFQIVGLPECPQNPTQGVPIYCSHNG